jgi:hypothetical protein
MALRPVLHVQQMLNLRTTEAGHEQLLTPVGRKQRP